ncbi:hypothetical protein BGU18_20910 [Clostridioides difficile]|nr:hypothetical protein BGU18_20910 [Clostridioides difficile]
MDAEEAEKGQQDPAEAVVEGAGLEAQIRLAIHGREQEQIDQPADAQQAQGAEPDRAGDRLAIREAMGAEKTEDPQQIAHDLAVSVLIPHAYDLAT